MDSKHEPESEIDWSELAALLPAAVARLLKMTGEAIDAIRQVGDLTAPVCSITLNNPRGRPVQVSLSIELVDESGESAP